MSNFFTKRNITPRTISNFTPSSNNQNPLILEGTAVVVDVIRNEESTLFNTRKDFRIGTIKFHFIGQTSKREDDNFNFTARPMEVGLQELPLKNDIVMIYRGLAPGRIGDLANQEIYFYTRRLNINSTLQYNFFGNVIARSHYINSSDQNSDHARQSELGVMNKSSDTGPSSIEDNYSVNENIKNLKHFDGDILLQNRYGTTIRLGSSQMEDAFNQNTEETENGLILGPTNTNQNDPILIFRVGQREDPITTTDSTYALLVEDINLDSSCFVMSENQQINFHFSSDFRVLSDLKNKKQVPSLYLSKLSNESDGVEKVPLFGNQMILNSSRIVLNSKETDLVFSSNQHTVITANQNVVLDSGNSIYINPDEGKVFLGTVYNLNSVVKYNELSKILNLIKTCLDMLSTRPGTVPPLTAIQNMTKQMNVSKIKSDVVKIGD